MGQHETNVLWGEAAKAETAGAGVLGMAKASCDTNF
jgi:hypothetical protein